MIDTTTAEKVLRAILEIKPDILLNNPIPNLKEHLPDLSENILLSAVLDFKKRQLINAFFADDTVYLITVNPSATGYLRKLEEDKKAIQNQPSIQQIFNVDKNYGAIGTNTNITINNNFDFEELHKLIQENTESNSKDRAELENLKVQLELINQHNIPISKGCLNKFNETMQKHSWITGQLAGFLIRWTFGQHL